MSVVYTKPDKDHQFTAEQEDNRIRWAKRFIARLEGVGQGLGYGIFHGGSLIRDIDVVAVPWREGMGCAGDPLTFVRGLVHSMGLHKFEHGHNTLFGHYAATLWAEGHADHPIDLKVIRAALHPTEPGSREEGGEA